MFNLSSVSRPDTKLTQTLHMYITVESHFSGFSNQLNCGDVVQFMQIQTHSKIHTHLHLLTCYFRVDNPVEFPENGTEWFQTIRYGDM